MQGSKPDYQNLGLSTIMGPQLRLLVETQLLADLTNYRLEINNLKFDWSGSCIQGHDASYLDGQLENFSGISLFDTNDQLIADGWMEFIHEGNFFLAYWEFITVWKGKRRFLRKQSLVFQTMFGNKFQMILNGTTKKNAYNQNASKVNSYWHS